MSVKSNLGLVMRWVSQGSILGILLYISITNESPAIKDHVVMWTDDTFIINREDEEDIGHLFEDSLKRLMEWITLLMNMGKTQMLKYAIRTNACLSLW